MTISIEIIGSAFIMGLAGSLHCVGMCGPLAFSLPFSHQNNLSRFKGGLIYNTGRILSYTLLGLLFGSFGNLFIRTQWQSKLSIALGLVILLYLFTPKRWLHFNNLGIINKPFILLRQQLGKLFNGKNPGSLFSIGILNGFLPCGLVYLALSSSIISASATNGGLFMLFFGLGTFPLMFATVLLGNFLNQQVRQRIYKSVPILLSFMAILLILRGMNLGIPFISPEAGSNVLHQTVICR